MLSDGDSDFRLQRVVCNDRRCQNIMFVSSLEIEIECFQCGQKFLKNSLRNVQGVMPEDFANGLDLYIRRLLLTSFLPKRGPEMVKVLGLSNYYCKLLSPFLTRYGMDKETGKAKLLKDMNRGEIFDCSSFGDRAFLIEPEHVNIPGFGRDITGSMNYLSETLKLIRSSNGNEERLLPIHTDGDGHCLVHAISRALVGRELFWHPLRCCLKKHFETNLDKYKELFKDFIDTEEWQSIIDECDPEFKPPEGELHGLRNIHIFGLANVLKRPIILLDSLECMKKCGDYSAIFLPGLVDAEGCRGRDKSLNKPICIAWSSYSHNHYIPLVGIRNMPLPVLPLSLLPKVWGMPQSETNTYIEFDDSGNCTIGGCRVLSDNYIQRLVVAMEGQFFEHYKIHPSLVADTKLFLCADNVLLNTKAITVIQKAKALVAEERLFKCMHCKALNEMHFDLSWFCRGGVLYNSLFKINKNLVPGKYYDITIDSIYHYECRYEPLKDVFIPNMNSSFIEKCCFCQSTFLKRIRADGSIVCESESDLNEKKNPQGLDKIGQLSEKQSEDVPEMLILKIKYGDLEAEDVIPDFKLVKKECIGKAVVAICSSFICKHFPKHVHNVALHTFVAEKIVQTAGISTVRALPSQDELNIRKKEECIASTSSQKQLTASTNPSSTETQSCPSTSNRQFVKVVSQNAQVANLSLSENGISYFQLQEWIKDKFSIPIPNQTIKIGFPPKELEPPVDSTQPLPLKHGDRLVVENCPKQITSRPSSASIARNAARDFSSQKPYTTYQSDVLWNLAKLSPEQFRKGGKFYEEVAGSRILYDMVHFFIDSFPNKTFSYNHHSDSIELCVKPLGHFEISVDLDSRIEQVQEGESVKGYRKCPVMSLKIGHKDPVVNKTLKKNLPSTAQTSSENHAIPLVRKGPGFSILTSPEPPERMDIT
ncbi:deubiquitinating protein VCPIP1-like isoform X2 [Argiope bruennichi]|uniref:deubiquitinating protein VCPIP1-like isoform X2 n=1 Tax=Argiope bruennichi TaxID=94029 RepID=UPI0024942EC9|nr:deubiquitinating protein VCPIP1-like isoform X2 [Argiope bruennichi]